MKPKMFTRRAGTPPSGLYVRFGYVEGHSLPWEGYRAGQIVERPADELGHGVIVGATGSGKTVASYPVIYYPVVGGGWGSIVVDFKASAKTREAVRAAALAAGKPFIALQVGTPVPGEEPAFYEPFNWAGTPEEKASMLLSCFDMTTEGAASYYTSVAQGWLRFCFRLLEHTGLSNGESTMDFLLRMCSTAEAKSAIKKVSRTNAPAADHLTRAIGHTITPDEPSSTPPRSVPRARSDTCPSPRPTNLSSREWARSSSSTLPPSCRYACEERLEENPWSYSSTRPPPWETKRASSRPS